MNIIELIIPQWQSVTIPTISSKSASSAVDTTIHMLYKEEEENVLNVLKMAEFGKQYKFKL